MTGTASTAFQAALDNLIEKGDTVLIPINGLWLKRALDTCERLGKFDQKRYMSII